ncbi:MAG TPA: FAD-binding oxidoreductase, partial [Solirubrobacterales bacterium]|nr:FAD-binding oxidoreductase [Solirubrobacterales bacterium]
MEPELDAEALAVLRERIGELEPWPLARALEEFELPPAETLPRALVEAVGEANVFTGAEERLRHATGRGYVDLARLRNGALEAAPDAVAVPPDAEALRRLLD